MCCGMCDCEIGTAVGNILYVSERLASCCAAMFVVVCLVGTLITMMAMGIGLGYNYCLVDQKLGVQEPLESDDGSGEFHRRMMPRRTMPRQNLPDDASIVNENDQNLFRKRKHAKRRSIDSDTKIPADNKRNKFQTSVVSKNTELVKKNFTVDKNNLESTTESSAEDIEIKPTMVVPLKKINLHSLIVRLKRCSMNVTLELIQ